MALFQNSVLNKYLKGQDKEALSKAFKKFTKYFHDPKIQDNIRSSKEEEYQGIFLTELFSKILGYTMKPNANFNLVAEYKNEKNSKKADGAILKDDLAIGVIELKGTNTKDLEAVRQQAFDYKANQTGCVYVITSNFEKLRFYINNAVDFEEFDLFNLTEERFNLLYLCLAKENLLNNIPLKIKEASIQEEEAITKQFYNDYSQFKRELFRDLVKLNMKNEVFRAELNREDAERANKNIKHNLFKKSQKLIDRYLFIFFAEDRGLLPPNSTLKILEQWDKLKDLDAYAPLYDRYKLYFNYLDTGRKGTDKTAEIFAYNGGLFKPDAILDSLKISDELLYKHTKALSHYDFDSQVDVNILGHIFENSLNEIESVNAEIEGTDFDKQKTKRKKDGVFYTPKYITKYIVDNTVGKLCTEKKDELGVIEEEYFKSRKGRTKAKLKELLDNIEAYREWLLHITILDPACGSGAFLNQALDFLIKEHQYIDELQTNLLGGGFVFPDIENTVLENNIFGVDLNEESVEIAKLSLWLRTAQPRRKLNDLSSNIKCGNSLIESKAVAGDKAFKWEDEFPQVFKEKEKKAFHITTATHDSRTSQRMVDYKVRELRDNGTRPKAESIWLEPEDEALIVKTVAEIVKEDELNVMAFNVCGDHMHILLVCEEEGVNKIIQKIKAKTARAVNIAKGITTPLTREHAPLSSESRGKKQHSLWTQKFGNNPIKDEKQLWNTVKYIQNNRVKHDLPPLVTSIKGVGSLIETINSFCCTYNHAFRPENKGGFDVVIGNPPYVNFANLPKEEREFFKKTSKVCKNKTDLYAFFVEKSTAILKSEGKFSFIFPHTWVSTTSFTPLRKLFFDNYKINSLVELEHGVFQDAIVKTVIIVCEKDSEFIGVPVFNEDFKFVVEIPKDILFNDEEMIINFDWTPEKQKIENKLFKDSVRLDSLLRFTRGIKTSNDKRFLHFEKKDGEYKRVIRGRNIKAYRTDFVGEYVWYRPDLMREKVGCLPHTKELFEVPEKLITQRVNSSGQLLVTYDDQQYYCLDTTNVTVIEKDLDINLKYLLVIINSNLINWWFNDKFKMPTISGYELHQIPIKIDRKIENVIVDFGNKKLEQEPIFRDLLKKYTKYLQSQFSIEKLSKKLQNWHELEFGDFIKELNKAIKKEGREKLSKMDEMDWMEVFETKKAEALTLKAEIDKTDKEIDAMVYELYGLSEEEIKIVEG